MATEALVMGGHSAVALSRVEGEPTLESRRDRVQLGGVSIDCIDADGASLRIRRFLRDGRSHQIVTVNLDFLSIAERNPGFRAAVNQADMAVADGMPLVWLSRLTGKPLPERVAGVELVHESCRVAAETGTGVFLLGAGAGVAETAARTLEQLYPGLRVVGTYAPGYGQLSADQNQAILDQIASTRPGFLFVALGAPRQDLWIREHLARLDVPVAMGVGCVFDLLAGNANRAPGWMRRVGLEWAFRLVQEPRRLWRRYLLDDTPLLLRLLGSTLFGGHGAVDISPSVGSASS